MNSVTLKTTVGIVVKTYMCCVANDVVPINIRISLIDLVYIEIVHNTVAIMIVLLLV